MEHNNLSDTMFESIFTLRSVLGDTNVLQIIHPGNVWQASFEWEPIAREEDILSIEADLSKKIPRELVIFYTSVADGAKLYYDIKYGQWGYVIYGSGLLISKQEYWQDYLSGDLLDNYLVIGEMIDNRHLLIFNLEEVSKDQTGCQMIEGGLIDPVKYWPEMSPTFHEWIEHLITAQGAKYWYWK